MGQPPRICAVQGMSKRTSVTMLVGVPLISSAVLRANSFAWGIKWVFMCRDVSHSLGRYTKVIFRWTLNFILHRLERQDLSLACGSLSRLKKRKR